MEDVQNYAYAYASASGISIDTISSTKRKAMVNALGIVFNVPIYTWHTDAQIQNMFDEAIGTSAGGIVKVRIELLTDK